jgi:L-2-hydroxyglutarate oxidase LhgO
MRTRPEADVVVVGAGVVGLACAAALARSGREVVVLERREAVAREVTSRSSEVIHAGLYYPTGSLKARHCVRGRELLYARCAARGVPHRRLGKLVVACDAAEAGALERLAANARANGVRDLELLDARGAAALEPDLRVHAALLSPATGIVDAHALADDLLAEAEAAGARLVTRAEVRGVATQGDRFRLEVRDADGRGTELDARGLVNAAGLAADRIAARLGVDVEARGWRIHPCKGDYFALAPAASITLKRLVYPLPAADGALGVHATLDLGGRIRFGPDAEYVAEPRYDVDAAKAEAFAAAVSRYLPGVRREWLTPDYAGVRPRLGAPGEAPRDFVVEAAPPGAVHLVGIDSPGLTAALSLAEEVCALLASA